MSDYKNPSALWEHAASGVLQFRIPILLAAFFLTLIFAWQALHLRAEWNEQKELPAGDSDIVYFQRFVDRFGGQENLVILLQADEIFTPSVLQHLDNLTEQFWDVPHASDVVSLASVSICRGSGDEARIEPFLPEGQLGSAAAVALRGEALAHPLWSGNLVSADGKIACINVMLPSLAGNVNDRREAVDAVQEILDENPLDGVRWWVTGYSPLVRDMQVFLKQDIQRFLWLTPLLIMVCLFLAFRTWRGVLAPAIVIVASAVWSLGILSLFGGTLNIGTLLLPTLVAVNGLSYSIHLMNEYHEGCARGNDPRKLLVQTVARQAPPLLMAGVTTAIGFGSLSLSELHSLRQLGVFSAIGILLSVLLCLTLIPALLSFLPLPAKASHRHGSVRRLRQGLWSVAEFVQRDRWRIPAALILVGILSVIGMRQMQVEAQVSLYLPESAPSIQGLKVVEDHLSGFYVLELELDGEPGAFHEPWALREMDDLQQQIEGLAGVAQVVSANDFYKEMHQARTAHSSQSDGLPQTAGLLAEYRLLFSMSGHGAMVDSFLTPDGSAARLSVHIDGMSTAGHLKLISRIEELASTELDPRLELHPTGTVQLFAVRIHALVRSLLKSFGLSFLLIAVVMMIQLRSARAGLCSMIPNVLPVLLGFGLMGFLGIPLSASTVMIASVGIGIAVDDTIHVLMRYRRELGPGRSPASSLHRMLLGTGRAMVFSSLALAAGFTVLAFSRFRPNREFGLLIAFIMVVALLSDLFVTPWLIRSFRLFQKERL